VKPTTVGAGDGTFAGGAVPAAGFGAEAGAPDATALPLATG
jgi:hypothetical protein